MDFLNKLVLPQSTEYIAALEYLLIFTLVVFVPFISILFGGTLASIHYGKQFKKTRTLFYKKFSKDIIEYVTINKTAGILLGIIPLAISIFIFAQIFQESVVQAVSFLAISFVLILVAMILIYMYRSSALKSKVDSPYINLKHGKLGIIFLFIGIWFYVAAITSATNFVSWNFPGLITSLAAPKVLINLMIFAAFAISLTSAVILFLHFYWKDSLKDEDPAYTKFVKDNSAKVGLKASIPLPILILINLFTFSNATLSNSVFIYTVIGLLLLFMAYNFFYVILYKNEYKFGTFVFVALILSSFAFIIRDQKIITNSTAKHTLQISAQYTSIPTETNAENTTEELSSSETAGTKDALKGKDIYDLKCASCHKFDQKFVGPAHFDVLPKYAGDEAKLVAFIMNPVKVNPDFPPMPNPGLTQQEAEAVSKYLLDEYQKKK